MDEYVGRGRQEKRKIHTNKKMEFFFSDTHRIKCPSDIILYTIN